jgi:hypothetical protein
MATSPPTPAKQFSPEVKKGMMTCVIFGGKRKVEFDVFDGITAHLTRDYDGNVHNFHVVDITLILREGDLRSQFWCKEYRFLAFVAGVTSKEHFAAVVEENVCQAFAGAEMLRTNEQRRSELL